MIVTKKPQLIDAKNRKESLVYIRVARQEIFKDEVHFDIELSIIERKGSFRDVAVLDSDKQLTFGSNGLPITKKQPIIVSNLKVIGKEKAVFKTETFFSKIGHITPSDYDMELINQIEYLNSRDWGGKVGIYYWNLKSSDLEIVSDEKIKQLLTVKEV